MSNVQVSKFLSLLLAVLALSAPPAFAAPAYDDAAVARIHAGIVDCPGCNLAGADLTNTCVKAKNLTGARKDCPIRLYIMLREGNLDRAVELKKAQAADEWGARYGAIKCFYGNSLSGQTAWLYEPYAAPEGYTGIPPSRGKASAPA